MRVRVTDMLLDKGEVSRKCILGSRALTTLRKRRKFPKRHWGEGVPGLGGPSAGGHGRHVRMRRRR